MKISKEEEELKKQIRKLEDEKEAADLQIIPLESRLFDLEEARQNACPHADMVPNTFGDMCMDCGKLF